MIIYYNFRFFSISSSRAWVERKGCAGAEGDIVDSRLITRSGILDADVEGKYGLRR